MAPNNINSNGLSILVIDDVVFNQLLAKTILEKNGFKVSLANNGNEALALIQTNKYDLVLLDMQMPIMDGFEVLNKLNELNITVPVIAMTALTFTNEKKRIFSLGADGYISKPINKDRLLSVISDVLNLNISLEEHPRKTQTSGGHIDLSTIRNATDGNKEQMNQLLNIFALQSEELLLELNSAINLNKSESIPGLMHKLLNSVRMFGLTSMEEKVVLLSKQKEFNIEKILADLYFIQDGLRDAIDDANQWQSRG